MSWLLRLGCCSPVLSKERPGVIDGRENTLSLCCCWKWLRLRQWRTLLVLLLLWKLWRRLRSRLCRTLILRRHIWRHGWPSWFLLVDGLHLRMWYWVLRVLRWMLLLWMLSVLELGRLRLGGLWAHLQVSSGLWVVDGRVWHIGIAWLLRRGRLRDLQMLMLGRSEVRRRVANMCSRARSRQWVRLW